MQGGGINEHIKNPLSPDEMTDKIRSDAEVMVWVFGMLVVGAALLGIAILCAEEILAWTPLT